MERNVVPGKGKGVVAVAGGNFSMNWTLKKRREVKSTTFAVFLR